MTVSDLTAATGWLADTHAHLYSCFPVQQYFESAISNIDRFRGAGAGTGCLMVAETAADRSFSRLVESAPRALPGGYTLHATSESTSFVVTTEAGTRLVLVAGRQIVTAEGLEVLVFGSAVDDVADGRDADAVLARAAGSESVAIVPWGFGKWWFGRGAVVRRLVRDHAGSVALGDNGGRPAGTRPPHAFRLARGLGVPVLPGSDPLPLPSQVGRAGSYGVVLPCSPDLERPAAQILSLLRARPAPRESFGDRISPFGFVAAQIALRAARRPGRWTRSERYFASATGPRRNRGPERAANGDM